MGIAITFAGDAAQRDALYASRYRVIVEDDQQYPRNDARRVADPFDAIPATRNVIAIDRDDGGAVIGGVRFTEATPDGMPVSAWLDVADYLPANVGNYGCGGSFFLDRRYRKSRIAGDILTMGYAWALSRGWTHLIAALNPDILGTFLRYGYQQLSDIRHDPEKHLPYVPVLLDFATLEPDMRALCAQIPQARITSPGGNHFAWTELPAPTAAPTS